MISCQAIEYFGDSVPSIKRTWTSGWFVLFSSWMRKVIREWAGQLYLQQDNILHASLINNSLMEELICDVTKSANNDAF